MLSILHTGIPRPFGGSGIERLSKIFLRFTIAEALPLPLRHPLSRPRSGNDLMMHRNAAMVADRTRAPCYPWRREVFPTLDQSQASGAALYMRPGWAGGRASRESVISFAASHGSLAAVLAVSLSLELPSASQSATAPFGFQIRFMV